MVRSHVLDVLGHVVHARISMERLQLEAINEMQQGSVPLAFGHYWGKEHLDALASAAHAIEVAWHLLKWIQTPAAASRLLDAQSEVSALTSSSVALITASTSSPVSSQQSSVQSSL